jgi:hypothetical protein
MTHWKKLTNPDYLGAYAIEPPTAEPILIIKEVKREIVHGVDGKKEECTVAYFSTPNYKPMILNATNCKSIQKAHNTPHIEEWAGKAIQIFVTQVKAFGDTVDALRIRPIAPKVQGATKEVMNESHPKWNEAIKYLASGETTVIKIAAKYELSEADKEKLVDAAAELEGGQDA